MDPLIAFSLKQEGQYDSFSFVPPGYETPRGIATGSPVVARDLVTNGTFAADTDWTKGTGWTISGGTANKAAGTGSDLEQTNNPVNGITYTLSFVVSSMTAGTLTPKVGGTAGTAISANGSHSEDIVSGGSGLLEFTADASFDGSIDNVVLVRTNIKQLRTSGWTAGQTGIMKQGDFFKFSGHSKVYRMVEDVDSDGSGISILEFRPALVVTPSDGETITVSSVPFTVSFASDVIEIPIRPPLLHSYAVSLVEHL